MTTLMKLAATMFAAAVLFAGPASAIGVQKLYVGNLSTQTTETDLRAKFEQYGSVESVNIVLDQQTGRPRGFAFVEMSTSEGAQAAIAGLNGTELYGRNLVVNAQEQPVGRWDGRSSSNPRERGGQRSDRRGVAGRAAATQPAAVQPAVVEPEPSKFLYLANIDQKVNLQQAIEEFGEVVNIKEIGLRWDSETKIKAFVQMSSVEEAKAAIAGLQNWKTENGITIVFASPKLVEAYKVEVPE